MLEWNAPRPEDNMLYISMMKWTIDEPLDHCSWWIAVLTIFIGFVLQNLGEGLDSRTVGRNPELVLRSTVGISDGYLLPMFVFYIANMFVSNHDSLVYYSSWVSNLLLNGLKETHSLINFYLLFQPAAEVIWPLNVLC